VPELPEVEALARFLADRLAGTRIADLTLASLSALKTYDPPVTDLVGCVVAGVSRRGKFLDLATDDGPHLVWHLSRAGWVRWHDEATDAPVRPGRGPLALRLSFVTMDGEPAGRVDITEAGTQKRLALYVVHDPAHVPGVARLGPDALALDLPGFRAILRAAGRAQVKGVLRDQSLIAGIGNAYSDEILHAARLSPFHPCATLSDDDIGRLFEVLRDTLGAAVAASVGQGTGTLKAEKKASLTVHGRAGEACPTCGDTIREIAFATSALQYCPTCQTGGKPLADRRMSRLLK
jgi:formamidopyrimidine-DNA glycosylase